MNKWKSLFLVKSMLSRTTNLNNPTDVIYHCVGLAYRDMLDGGRFYISNDKIGRCKGLIEILENHNYVFSRDLIAETTKLFGVSEEIGTGKKYVTRYGLAQKFVNMTFKYLYVFSDYTGKTIDFSGCDCPLDSIILGQLPKIEHAWSKITVQEYIACQDEISKKLQNEKLDLELLTLGRLAFDFLGW